MSTLIHVLKEERDRLKDAVRGYEERIALLPKGSPRRKKVKNKVYLYLTVREQSKVLSIYVGEIESEKAIVTLAQIEKRDLFRDKLKEVKSSLKEIEKVLREKKMKT